MPIKGNNTIKYNHGEKSIKMPFNIYADLECLLEKMSTCQNDPNKSSTTKINKHTPSGYLNFNFGCLGKNTEKYITFSVPIKKKIDNKDLEITYKITFIDSYRFMSSLLSKLVYNLSEGIHNNKCSDCESNLDEEYLLNEDLMKKFKNTYRF